DCLPILLAAPDGRGVAALHAGWRGLAGAGAMAGRGITHSGVQALCEATGCAPEDLRAWLGPCIGPTQFEVGPDVLKGFGFDPDQVDVGTRFVPHTNGKWLANLPGLAQRILRRLGVAHFECAGECTVPNASRFFSFRRDGV